MLFLGDSLQSTVCLLKLPYEYIFLQHLWSYFIVFSLYSRLNIVYYIVPSFFFYFGFPLEFDMFYKYKKRNKKITEIIFFINNCNFFCASWLLGDLSRFIRWLFDRFYLFMGLYYLGLILFFHKSGTFLVVMEVNRLLCFYDFCTQQNVYIFHLTKVNKILILFKHFEWDSDLVIYYSY
jgi:hypothetical protein